MINLENIIIEKWKGLQFAPFYIFKAGALQIDPVEKLSHWSKKLVFNWALATGQLPNNSFEQFETIGHSDLIWINAPENERNYKNDDAGIIELFKTQAYGPTSWNRKFIVIERIDLISQNISNKLLKTLEEPQEQTTIIFLNPIQSNILQTILSRAIVLNIPLIDTNLKKELTVLSSKDQIFKFIEANHPELGSKKNLSSAWEKIKVNHENFLDFINEIKRDKLFVNKFLGTLNDATIQSSLKFETKEKFLKNLENYSYLDKFNSSTNHILASMLQSLFSL